MQKSAQLYSLDGLTEEEISLIISSLYREMHLVQSERHYKTGLLKILIDKIGVKSGYRKSS